ncbi:MAG: Elongation factor 4 [Parcubacteria group bacterium GW2011_GWB1_49_7]|uniref:Elongation factor 4 n=1 Tax=Candidatus Zambryskibacteria bacterium RIFCSPHIGHO2_01_FULL_46_25 TaxID=1802738 RepID=A0A1G2T1E8_9BACT|nr:MAG: Elongation factor 4 [Parcubacteria group bacterium GW2011_GWA1_47_10]KKW10060.1 MAG: Elongation factor 4 [Parcubacteria group bacterium GW2011_GWB1_49_7]OHA90461.1 MAG: elongation factor 4 [Candidatus Zambryskibacteria bacterium RIFCSPHIGHO2_01_FULL_46_25]OHB01966.1 MAG: elongation factor 4 [Candidatus Zambryskibacteria bacterium RIFCSPHIGHO2_12_FULL_48_10]OHB06999.1 MAG: elongation factor 4 [Candidatus Zambryskibacteria bacterium RIFCSPLOWO2_01_FULL_48_25]
MTNNIRNFSIIAHIDHGKSTLADRMLEITGTIEKRDMRDQVLDSMDLERERGITIKMQPVRMIYHPKILNPKSEILNKSQISNSKNLGFSASDLEFADSKQEFVLNLIDTPGHIDFSYEVSRALRAVEGSILLVDATQGVQAQTLTTLGMAQAAGLKIIPVISKIDSSLARVEEVCDEIVELLGVERSEILEVSGRTGVGVENLLEEIIKRVPAPNLETQFPSDFRSLVFDFKYSSHRGVIVFVRVFSGEVKKGDRLAFKVAGKEFQALEVGIFAPEEKASERLSAGEIGYIVTGIKEPGIASVGDTVASFGDSTESFPGYESAKPVVWASVYPENQDHFTGLKQALSRLQLSDSAFSFEEESSGVLGRGFRCGFLGMLHLEIITERLRREFSLPLVITLPSITYRIIYKNPSTSSGQAIKEEMVYTPSFFPEDYLIEEVWEPWITATVILPPKYLGALIQLLHEHEAEQGETESFGDSRTAIRFEMPLRELMRGFFDRLKSVTSGFGSISYVLAGERKADVTRLDILVADEVVPAFAKVVSKRQAEGEAEAAVEKLHDILPRQMFTLKIQAQALGRIISSRTMSGMKKDVTQHMYGGDITRKMKLREKQKKGKKKMKERGRVNIPQDVFLKMIKRD